MTTLTAENCLKSTQKISYSLEGTDLILQSIFRCVDYGTYIDVGANHPIHQSNTYFFYKNGWSGLAIEGNEEFCDDWIFSRPRDFFINALVSDRVKEVCFTKFSDSTLNSIDEDTTRRYKERSEHPPTNVTTLSTTIWELCETHLGNKEVHLLNIDVEGEDFNALKGSNLDTLNPGVICIEAKNCSLSNIHNNEIVNFLYSSGYKLIAKTPLDAIFINPQKKYLQWVPTSLYD